MQEFLNELEETPDSDAISVYMLFGMSVPEIENLMESIGIQTLPDELSRAVAGSKNGAVLFRCKAHMYLILPPFPFSEKIILNGYDTGPLRLLVSSNFLIGLILLHLGTYAIGVCQGENLITSKVGTGLVHGRHKKGGSSQQRFQRHRQNQIDGFLDRVCMHVTEHLGSHAQKLDYIIYGGPYHTVLLLQKRCHFLKSLGATVLPLLNVPSLRQKVLETTVGRVWSSCIIEWQEGEV